MKVLITSNYPTRYTAYENKGVLVVNEKIDNVHAGFEYAVYNNLFINIEVSNYQNKSVLVSVFCPFCSENKNKFFTSVNDAIEYAKSIIPELEKETYQKAYKELINLQRKENDLLITKRMLEQEIKDSTDKLAKIKKQQQLKELQKELEVLERNKEKLRVIVNHYEQ